MPKKTPVIDAVQAEDIQGDCDKKVLTLLKRGESVDEINDQGLNPLMAAASSGDLKTAQVLLTRGARPDQANSLSAGKCPIVCVAEKKKFDMVKLLLRNKAQPFPALLYTAKTNDTELISKLVRECRISAYSTSFDGNTIKNLLSISRQSPVYKLLTALEMEEDDRKRTFDNAKKILMGFKCWARVALITVFKGPSQAGPFIHAGTGCAQDAGKTSIIRGDALLAVNYSKKLKSLKIFGARSLRSSAWTPVETQALEEHLSGRGVDAERL